MHHWCMNETPYPKSWTLLLWPFIHVPYSEKFSTFILLPTFEIQNGDRRQRSYFNQCWKVASRFRDFGLPRFQFSFSPCYCSSCYALSGYRLCTCYTYKSFGSRDDLLEKNVHIFTVKEPTNISTESFFNTREVIEQQSKELAGFLATLCAIA